MQKVLCEGIQVNAAKGKEEDNQIEQDLQENHERLRLISIEKSFMCFPFFIFIRFSDYLFVFCDDFI